VDSPDELCMVVSVQNITCPVADLEDRTGAASEGIRQTVDKRSGLTVRRDLFPAGLHIVFIVKPDDLDCQQKSVIRHGGNGVFFGNKLSYKIFIYISSRR
jgi:hypothetical protein